jgi:GDSL-like Lipase/Acylhydrolase family
MRTALLLVTLGLAGCSSSSPDAPSSGGAAGSEAGGVSGAVGSIGGATASIGGAAGESSGGVAGGGAGASSGSGGASGSTAGGSGGASGQSAGGSAGSGGGSAGSAGANGVLRIMPVGDSITVGSSGTNAGYRGPLYNLLKKSIPQVLFVGSSLGGGVTTQVDPLPVEQRHSEGHSSYTINDVNNNLDGLDRATFEQYGGPDRDPNGGHWFDGIASGPHARPALYPDIITLMIGTNNASATDRAAVQAQLHVLITKITTQRPEAQLIVAQITPSNRPNNVNYNAVVASEVAAFKAAGKHVSVVDMYTSFPADGLGVDSVHPNDKGYAFMAQQWFTAITAIR